MIAGHRFAAADHGLVQRADIIAICEESGSNQGAAGKAVNRWLDDGRLVKTGRVFMCSATAEPPRISKVFMLVLGK